MCHLHGSREHGCPAQRLSAICYAMGHHQHEPEPECCHSVVLQACRTPVV